MRQDKESSQWTHHNNAPCLLPVSCVSPPSASTVQQAWVQTEEKAAYWGTLSGCSCCSCCSTNSQEERGGSLRVTGAPHFIQIASKVILQPSYNLRGGLTTVVRTGLYTSRGKLFICFIRCADTGQAGQARCPQQPVCLSPLRTAARRIWLTALCVQAALQLIITANRGFWLVTFVGNKIFIWPRFGFWWLFLWRIQVLLEENDCRGSGS